MSFHIFTDGASRGNPGEAGIGVAIFKDAKEYDNISAYVGERTNNEAEYLGVIRALEWMHKEKEVRAIIVSDSQLLVKQIRGEYKVKAKTLQPLVEKVRKLLDGLDVTFEWVRREENSRADALANEAIDNK